MLLFLPHTVALQNEIANANARFIAAFAQVANGVAALYTDNCYVLIPGEDRVDGREGNY